MTLEQHIHELRSELRSCAMTRSERARVNAELARAIAEQREADQAFDADFATLCAEGR
jgi:hypothetical protein